MRKADDALDERQRRAKQPRVKETIVREKGYLNLRLVKEEIAEFTHQPSKAKGVYRMVVLCKTILEERGQRSLGQRERYHFYVTNDFTMSAEDVVREATIAATRRTSSRSSRAASAPCERRSTRSTPTGPTW